MPGDVHDELAAPERGPLQGVRVLDLSRILAGPTLAAVVADQRGHLRGVAEAFADPQAIARGMRVEVPSTVSGTGSVSLIGSPLKLSRTPVTYRRAPPSVGADESEVLADWLGDER